MDNDDDRYSNEDDIDKDNDNAERSRALPAGDKTMTPAELMASQ